MTHDMPAELSDESRAAACRALRQWFASQELDPATAGIIMLDLQAELLVEKTKSIPSLQLAAKMLYTYLIFEIAARIR